MLLATVTHICSSERQFAPFKKFEQAHTCCYIPPMAMTPSTMLPLGTVAPDFKLPDTNGKTISLPDFRGKPVLVMFICNHCPFVKHVRAELAKLGRDYQPRGVGIIAVSF